jgi:hypothetical protein
MAKKIQVKRRQRKLARVNIMRDRYGNAHAEGLVITEGAEVHHPIGMTPADALELVETIAHHAQQIELQLIGAVAAARDAQVSWAALGQVLDMTGEGVRRRYGTTES